MEPVQHSWRASQVCFLSLTGSRLGVTARTEVASSTGNDNIHPSWVPIGRAYMQNLQINVVHHTAEMENSQLGLLPDAYTFSPLTEEGMYLKQVPLDLSTLNAWPAASWLFTREDKTRFLTAKLPLLSLPPLIAEQTDLKMLLCQCLTRQLYPGKVQTWPSLTWLFNFEWHTASLLPVGLFMLQ